MANEEITTGENGKKRRGNGTRPPTRDDRERPLPTPVHRGRGREALVGVFVIVGVIALFATLFALTDPALFRGRYEATLVVNNASGLRSGDDVRLRGVTIGRTRGFTLRPDGTVGITLELSRKFQVPSDSKILLRSTNVFGEMIAEVVPGTSPTPLTWGDTIRGETEQTLFSQAGTIADEARATLGQVRQLLSPSVVNNVQQSSEEVVRLIGELGTLTAQLQKMTQSLNRSANAVEETLAGPDLRDTMANLQTLTARLDAVAASLERTSGSAEVVMGRVAQGQGALGRLSRDEALYANANQAALDLSAAATQLARLAEDIRKNPGRYVKISVF